MKRAGVLLVVLGVVQLFGNAMQGRIPDQVLIVGAMMVIGGLIIWSLERVRDVLVETREIARDTLAIAAADPNEVL